MGLTFLKTGAAAHKEVEKADIKTEEAKQLALNGNPYHYRFWIPEGKETQITFLDGGLTEEGLLDAAVYWEHNLYLNGSWKNWYVCTQDNEVCPICEGGANNALVAAFTILDHTMWTDKKSVVHQNERRLFICKRETFKRLQKIASKRNGLTGITFDVSRTGDKSAGVGSDFDFVTKRTMEELKVAYGLKDLPAPYDYGEVIPYKDAQTLRKLGFGASSSAPIGSDDTEAMTAKSKEPQKTPNYDAVL